MSEEEMEEEIHKWANAQAPWEGPVERTYARTVFIDGLRAANTRSKSLTVEEDRTFTESEVRDIARKMNRILAFGRTESSNKAVASMLALHGIVLDPA